LSKLLIYIIFTASNPLVPGSSPGGPTRKANPNQKWWGFCLLSITLWRYSIKIF